jgi:thiol-disulfide isomerase/thioredoxin
LALGVAARAGLAADVKTLQPGASAPIWADLPGVDGKRHALADLDKYPIVVVAFTCNSCPYSVDYEDRLNAFAKEYEPKGVKLIAVNVNNEPADRLDKMIERAKEKKLVYSYVYDASQKIGRAFGATVTPHLFVLDPARKLAYVGAFDDSKRPEKVKKTYVKDAVEALLAGKKPAVATTRAAGCRILYE